MNQRRITFACELKSGPLEQLFADQGLIRKLQELNARVSLGLLDLTPERAAVVRRLNESGVPVTAWLLLPEDEGYWFNLNNASQAARRYGQFKSWTTQYHLKWSSVGLDIEPDMREIKGLIKDRWNAIQVLLPKIFDTRRYHHGLIDYRSLVMQIHADGYSVESYQIPLIVDDRKVHSTLLQRLGGLVDIGADCEVLMLYTSFMRGYGPGLLWQYACEAQAIGIGSTGGGVELGSQIRPLDWEELERDLLLANRFTDDLFIFSLEGCVRQGYLERIQQMDWQKPFNPPIPTSQRVGQIRKGLQTFLWLSSHLYWVSLAIIGLLWLFSGKRRR